MPRISFARLGSASRGSTPQVAPPPNIMRAALGAERSERIMEDHATILERAASAQRAREKRPHWKLARTSLQPRGDRIVRRGRERLSEIAGSRGAAWHAPLPKAKKGLAALPDSAFVFDEEEGGNSSGDEGGYSSDGSAVSVLANGQRVLPPRIRGREQHVLAIASPVKETKAAPRVIGDAKVAEKAHAAVKPRNVFQLVRDTVEGVVEDVKQWHTLPFSSAAEKCEFIATRNERLPALLMLFTVLLGVIILVAIAVSGLVKVGARRGAQDSRMVVLEGGAASVLHSRQSGFSATSMGSDGPLFRLVPIA